MRQHLGRPLVALLAATGLLTSACIGATPREDFVQEVRSRGGGVTSEALTEALDAVKAEASLSILLLRTLSIRPVDSTVSMQVQDPNDPSVVDAYALQDGTIRSIKPVQLSARDRTRSFPAHAVPVQRIGQYADLALRAFDAEGGWIQSYRVGLASDGADELLIWFEIEAPRSRGIVTMDVDGDVLEVAVQ